MLENVDVLTTRSPDEGRNNRKLSNCQARLNFYLYKLPKSQTPNKMLQKFFF